MTVYFSKGLQMAGGLQQINEFLYEYPAPVKTIRYYFTESFYWQTLRIRIVFIGPVPPFKTHLTDLL
jgi:hypothetical protein